MLPSRTCRTGLRQRVACDTILFSRRNLTNQVCVHTHQSHGGIMERERELAKRVAGLTSELRDLFYCEAEQILLRLEVRRRSAPASSPHPPEETGQNLDPVQAG